MDVLTAETFLAVLETGSFSRAAEILNVTQSTVSSRIRGMEEQLGRRVLTRSKAGVTVTRAGRQFRPFAETLVSAWRQGRQEVQLPDGVSGVIAIGAKVSLWDRLVLDWIPWMRSAMPDVAVRAEVGNPETLVRGTIDRFLDVAVLYSPRTRPGLEIEFLFDEVLIPVTTGPDRGGPHSADYVFVDWGPDFAAWHAAAFPDAAMPMITISHGVLGLAHILAHGGSGYFPERVVAPLRAEGKLSDLADAPCFRRPVHAVYQAGRGEKRFKRALDGLRHVVAEQNGAAR